MSLRIKVCGITNVDDALAAVDAGADALGFMLFPKSKRYIDPQSIADIVRALPPVTTIVGVFVNEELENIKKLKVDCHLDVIQLHGDESPEFCQQVPGRVIKAFQIREPDSLKRTEAYHTNGWLLDSYSPKERGGTGERFNWDWVSAAAPHKKPIMIAGGLTPENAAACVTATQPFGLDVSTGVEDSPGKKNADKIRRFVTAARSVPLPTP